MADKIPLVSVVIPMFNAAKFIPQTLESLLYQTLKNFEVIVVDDCSTDDSIEVVKSFSERFGGRLNIIKLPNNTGTPGLPRNVGVNFAHGKYIAFLDSDDLFTKTALEELTTLAEKNQADVLQMYSNFILWGGQERTVDDPAMTDFAALTNPKNFSLKSRLAKELTAPVIHSRNIVQRVNNWLRMPANEFWSTWLLFYRRDFLVANQIHFPAMLTCEDLSFAFHAVCLSKNYLSVPNVTYIVRPRIDSVSRDRPTLARHFHKRISALNEGFNELERVMNEINFFKSHPNYRYAVLRWFGNYRISLLMGFYQKNPAFLFNELVKQEFHPDNAALSAYLFNTVNVYRLQLMQLRQENLSLKNELQKYQQTT